MAPDSQTTSIPRSLIMKPPELEHILLLSDDALINWLSANCEPKYRAKQIFDWLYGKWRLNPETLPNLPKKLRAKLAESFAFSTSQVSERIESQDESWKLLVSFEVGGSVEAVGLKAPSNSGERVTFCLSSQVGCPVGCYFCASGAEGFERNLTAAEIIEQLLHCCRATGTRPDNLVFMGMGEPLLNLDNLLKALELIVSPARFAMSPRRITVSTSGWTPGIKRLAESGKQFNLALSLHAASDAIRAELIPTKFRRPIADVLNACRYFRERTGRKVTFECTLIDGLNDLPSHAMELARLALENDSKVNLIPMNSVDNSAFSPPTEEAVQKFLSILLAAGVQATCRLSKGENINAACGQLRLKRRERNQAGSEQRHSKNV